MQERAKIICFGEMDWSPMIHEQCTGRLVRDGQNENVAEIYLYAAGGSDPVIAETLGIKRSQSEGIINPQNATGEVLSTQVTEGRGAILARSILARHKTPKNTATKSLQ